MTKPNSTQKRPLRSSKPTHPSNTKTNTNQHPHNSNSKFNRSFNFLSHLQTLRDFLGNSTTYTESDLSACLRSCKYNVDAAAERLITGSWHSTATTNRERNGNGNRNRRMGGGTMVTGKNRGGMVSPHHGNRDTPISIEVNESIHEDWHIQPTTTIVTHDVLTRSNDVPPDENDGIDPESMVAAAVVEHRGHCSQHTPRKPTSTNKTTTTTTTTTKLNTIDTRTTPNTPLYLLCHRWIVANSTSRQGSTHYGEPVQITSSIRPSSSSSSKRLPKGADVVRFRSSDLEGRLECRLGRILAPLLGSDYIHIEAKMLMDDRCIGILAEVPLEIRVYLIHPFEFMALFGEEERMGTTGGGVGGWGWTGTTTTHKHGKGRGKTIGTGRGGDRCREAAYGLLQWAQYGDDLPLYTPSSSLRSSLGEMEEEEDGDEAEGVTNSDVNSGTNVTQTRSYKNNNDENDNGNDDMEPSLDDTIPSDQPAWIRSVYNPDDDTNHVDETGPLPRNDEDQDTDEGDTDDDTDARVLRDNGVVLRPYQRHAVRWMMRREGRCWYPSSSSSSSSSHRNVTNDGSGCDGSGMEEADRETIRRLGLLAELASSSGGSPTLSSFAGTHGSILSTSSSSSAQIQCEVGPVRVSSELSRMARSISPNGARSSPDSIAAAAAAAVVDHPLWQRRFLWHCPVADDREKTGFHTDQHVYAFYVNELLQTASHCPPLPPKGCTGGILADEMGLGKTVMLLSLIAKTKELEEEEGRGGKPMNDNDEEHEEGGTERRSTSTSVASYLGNPLKSTATLVVVPLSLLSQWEEEVEEKTNLTCLAYYGEGAKSTAGFGRFDVVVTTYGMLQQEYLRLSTTSSQPLLSHKWHRVILDEAHLIKNSRTTLSKSCCALRSETRWCATGTPVQNSLEDAYGLLKFLREEPWCEPGFWKRAVTDVTGKGKKVKKEEVEGVKGKEEQMELLKRKHSDPNCGGVEDGEEDKTKIALDRVRRVLSPLMMRRTKATLTADGKPIVTLPPVQTLTITVSLSYLEQKFYDALLTRSQATFDGLLRAGTANKSWFTIFSLLQRLRQACNHVGLAIKGHGELIGDGHDNSETANADEKASMKRSGEEGDRVTDNFLCQLLNTFHEQKINKASNDGSDSITAPPEKRQRTTSTSNNTTESDHLHITYADRIAHSLSQAVPSSTNLEDECPICLEKPRCDDLAVAPCAHVFCQSCLRDVLASNNNNSNNINKNNGGDDAKRFEDGECPVCSTHINASKIVLVSKQGTRSVGPQKRQRSAPNSPTIDDIATRRLLTRALSAESSKTTAILRELDEVWALDPGSKIVVFSQYLGFLDLLRAPLEKKNVGCFRLDGSMTRKERKLTLQNFRSYVPVTSAEDVNESLASSVPHRGAVLLASTKACGVGINLVYASTVFLVDPWWNGAVERQCIDRVHRIGQTAEVVRVRRFLVEGTVEEDIVSMQRKKERMSVRVLGDSDGVCEVREGEGGNPTLEDLRAIFRR